MKHISECLLEFLASKMLNAKAITMDICSIFCTEFTEIILTVALNCHIVILTFAILNELRNHAHF